MISPIRRLTGAVTLLLALAQPAAAQAPAIDYDKLRNETAQRLSEYIRINTSNPPGNELATARWLEEVLAKEGIEGQILDTAELGPGRANFYACLEGSGRDKAIALVHHMDVVPVSREFWSEDPFAGLIKDGYVWGRGALDMKGHGIIQLMTLIAIKRAGYGSAATWSTSATPMRSPADPGAGRSSPDILNSSRTSSTSSPRAGEAGSRTGKCGGSA